MTRRLLVASFCGGLFVFAAGAWLGAQGPRWTPLSEPRVLAGPDVGFRVTWMNGDVPHGQIVVRLNGRWVEAQVGEPPNSRLLPQPRVPDPPVK